jgi:Spy/CpxP family protein refolding chaperone
MTRLVVLLGFAVSFSAGLMVGLISDHGPSKPDDKPPRDRSSWLAEQLKLTPEQIRQMQEIWSETARRGGREQGDRRQQLRRQRDEAIAALVPESRRQDYERILAEYAAANEAIENEWRGSFDRAVARTKEILTPEQRERYEQLLSRQGWDGPGSGPRGRPPTRPFGEAPSHERDHPGKHR